MRNKGFASIVVACIAASAFAVARAQNVAPPWTVEVDFTQNLDPNTMAVYQQCAAALNNFVGQPNSRATFWAAVNSPPSSVINGWFGFVTDVQVEPTGEYFVTVLVTPDLSSSGYGPCTLVSGTYLERYTIAQNGFVQYVDSLDPEQMAGQVPNFIEGA